MVSQTHPAWSWQFAPENRRRLPPVSGLDTITPAWAWEGGTGAGVRVGVIDSGIDEDHPAVGGRVARFVGFVEGDDGEVRAVEEPHRDAFGHGTACADIIRRLAPDCELYSIKVLGAGLRGKGLVFAAGIRWAVEQGLDVVNLSLGSTKAEYFSLFHEVVDAAYFKNVVLVTAANNVPVASYPSLYATVLSVACHEG